MFICGFGRNGSRACEELLRREKEFVIIEKNPEMSQLIPEPMKSCIGDAAEDENLKVVGIEKATTLIITNPSDAVNVFITLTARH